MKLTKATIANLALPAGKNDVIFFDDEIAGLGLRIRAGGKRTWIAQYRVGAKQRRVTLGDVRKLDADKARTAARNRLAQVTLGGDPQADKATARVKAAATLGAVVDTYLAGKKVTLRPKSFDETERYLRKSWKPVHGLPVHKIERRAVAGRLAEIATDNGPIAATRARAALSALFAWAVREGLANENPVIGTNRPAEARSRDRVLTDAELREIWSACREDDYGRIVRLLILTGQRRDEVGGMTWSELDLDQGTWRISGSRTKNGRTHTITLPHTALTIVEKVERRTNNDRLFGKGDTGFGGWSKAKAALDERIDDTRRREGAQKPTDYVNSTPAWTVHDIRRSVATHMAELGVLPHVIEAVLNHVSGHKAGVAGVYNRSGYEREVRISLALWADHVRWIAEGGGRTVMSLPERAAVAK
jgi:integrase